MTTIAASGGYTPFVSADRNVSADEIAAQEQDLSFGDLLDVLNPLHHLPVIGTVYRQLTGDTISGPARAVGGMLYGGPVGLIGGVASAIMEESGGRDLGDTLVAAVFGESSAPEAAGGTALASAESRGRRGAGDASAQFASAQSAAAAPTPPAPTPPAPAANAAAPAAAPAAASEAPALSGLEALRAFARDSGLSGDAQQAAAPPAAASMPAPTTAASTSGQASTRQAPVDEQSAEAALQAAAGQARALPSDTEARRGGNIPPQMAMAGAPPSDDRFMPLGPRAFSGPMTTSARGAIAQSDRLAGLDLARAGDAFGRPAAELGAAGDYRPGAGMAASAQHPVADRMMEALLKYQALREGSGGL